MTIKIKNIGKSLAAALVVLALSACEAPTTGTEIYDGDPETDDPEPREMEQKAEEQRENTMEKQRENSDIQQ